MATGEKLEGYLVVKVLEAAGHNSSDAHVWEPTFTEGFVKVEIRGGPRTVKKQTSMQPVADNAITWEEQLALEVLDGSSELRIMLCCEKRNGDKVKSSIVAACGIYMRDIIEAVPIDKYFEMFKPGVGAEGGFIRVSMSFLEPDQVQNGNGLLDGGKKGGKKRGFPLVRFGLVLAAGAAVAFKLLNKPQ